MLRSLAAGLLAVVLPWTAIADEPGIRMLVDNYVNDFNAKRADKISDYWIVDGEYRDLTEDIIWVGREQISKEMKSVLDGDMTPKLSVTIASIRMLGDQAARVEGTTSIQIGNDESGEPRGDDFDFIALVVREDDAWKFSSIDERAVGDLPTASEALQQLAWLEGVWKDQTEDADVTTSVRWLPGRNFLLRVFQSDADGEDPQQGFQVIGFDPNRGTIRSWSILGGGSYGDGDWQVEPDRIRVQARQTLPGGSTAVGTYVIEKVDDATIRVKIVGRSQDGSPLPNSNPITVTRVVDSIESTAPNKSESPAK